VVGVCVLVYARTHTKTTWVLKRIIHVDRIGVHSTFVYIYAVLQVLMLWANCFFLLTCLFFLEK